MSKCPHVNSHLNCSPQSEETNGSLVQDICEVVSPTQVAQVTTKRKQFNHADSRPASKKQRTVPIINLDDDEDHNVGKACNESNSINKGSLSLTPRVVEPEDEVPQLTDKERQLLALYTHRKNFAKNDPPSSDMCNNIFYPSDRSISGGQKTSPLNHVSNNKKSASPCHKNITRKRQNFIYHNGRRLTVGFITSKFNAILDRQIIAHYNARRAKRVDPMLSLTTRVTLEDITKNPIFCNGTKFTKVISLPYSKLTSNGASTQATFESDIIDLSDDDDLKPCTSQSVSNIKPCTSRSVSNINVIGVATGSAGKQTNASSNSRNGAQGNNFRIKPLNSLLNHSTNFVQNSPVKKNRKLLNDAEAGPFLGFDDNDRDSTASLKPVHIAKSRGQSSLLEKCLQEAAAPNLVRIMPKTQQPTFKELQSVKALVQAATLQKSSRFGVKVLYYFHFVFIDGSMCS